MQEPAKQNRQRTVRLAPHGPLGVQLSAGGGGGGKGNGSTASMWATLATHLPGRSGRDCRERWALLMQQQEQQQEQQQQQQQPPQPPNECGTDVAAEGDRTDGYVSP